MNIVFAGTSDIAVPTLRKLSELATVAAVITAPDRPGGRGLLLSHSPVKTEALKLGLQPIFQPETLKAEARRFISDLPVEPDLLVVFAYGKILGPRFLSLFPKGAINIHPSLLPRYRGSSPLISALLNCDSSCGISVQKIAQEVDTGDLIAVKELPLSQTETNIDLRRRVSVESARFLADIWGDLPYLMENAHPQSTENVSYCSKIGKEDGELNWKEEGGRFLAAKIRAFQPWPKAWTYWHGEQLNLYKAVFADDAREPECSPVSDAPLGTVLLMHPHKGLAVRCKGGVLWVQELQLQTKKRLDWVTFFNGNRDIVGSVLGG